MVVCPKKFSVSNVPPISRIIHRCHSGITCATQSPMIADISSSASRTDIRGSVDAKLGSVKPSFSLYITFELINLSLFLDGIQSRDGLLRYARTSARLPKLLRWWYKITNQFWCYCDGLKNIWFLISLILHFIVTFLIPKKSAGYEQQN